MQQSTTEAQAIRTTPRLHLSSAHGCDNLSPSGRVRVLSQRLHRPDAVCCTNWHQGMYIEGCIRWVSLVSNRGRVGHLPNGGGQSRDHGWNESVFVRPRLVESPARESARVEGVHVLWSHRSTQSGAGSVWASRRTMTSLVATRAPHGWASGCQRRQLGRDQVTPPRRRCGHADGEWSRLSVSAGVVLTPRSTEDAQSALRPAVVPPLPPEAITGCQGRVRGKWANAVRDRGAGTSERAWND